jgi:hypothetical protein
LYVFLPLSSVVHDLSYRTINVVNTPFNNPKWKDVKKIKVVDPTHPLFGQSFKVAEWRNSPGSAGFVFVEYQHLTRLYIPIDVTDLAFVPRVSTTKLTCESIIALTNLGREIASLCHKIPNKFGNDCQPNNKEKS